MREVDFCESKKTEGVKIKEESQEAEKIKKLSLSHSARYTSRSCQLPQQMEPRNKVILTMGGKQCMTDCQINPKARMCYAIKKGLCPKSKNHALCTWIVLKLG